MENKSTIPVNFSDSKVRSFMYNDQTKIMTVLYGGGSKIEYRNVESSIVDEILNHVSARSVLESVRHNNIVGVRIR